MERKAKNTRQAEIDKFYEETGCLLTQTGEWLEYRGHITIPASTSFTELKGLEIYGNLYFDGNTSIKRLVDVKVWNHLNMDRSEVEELEEVHVIKNLYLPNSIKRLEEVKVGGRIYFG